MVETGIWIMVAMFSYYLLNQGLNVYNQNKEREFELKKLQPESVKLVFFH